MCLARNWGWASHLAANDSNSTKITNTRQLNDPGTHSTRLKFRGTTEQNIYRPCSNNMAHRLVDKEQSNLLQWTSNDLINSESLSYQFEQTTHTTRKTKNVHHSIFFSSSESIQFNSLQRYTDNTSVECRPRVYNIVFSTCSILRKLMNLSILQVWGSVSMYIAYIAR